MTHDEVEQQEIVERYVQNRLSAEDRGEFEEHFFACDSCFDQIQMMERFISGVRHAAETGILVARPEANQGAYPGRGLAWLKPLFWVTAAVAVGLLFWAGWLSLYRLPRLHAEMANERAERERIDEQREQEMDRALEQLESERAARARLEDQLNNQSNKSEQFVASLVQPNVPLVMLEGTRQSQAANILDLPSRTGTFVLWLEAEPEGRFRNFRLEIYTADKKLVQTVAGLKRNGYGAVAVSLPTAPFHTGKYLVGLYGVGAHDSELVGEFTLQIRKH